MKKAYILMGPPGSGKGTQAELLAEKKKLTLIQPGVYLRAEAEKKTKLAKKIKRLISRGDIVPGELVDRMVFNAINQTANNVLFDGYPRTPKQSEKLFDYLMKHKVKVYFIEIYLSDEQIIERINGRRSCQCGETYHVKYNPSKKKGICDKCGSHLYIRTDSKKSVIIKRIKVYYQQTAPVLQYFKQNNNENIKFVFIDGDKPIKQVFNEVIKSIQ